MKSKNIPADIKQKSIKEAQTEINDLIIRLENPKAELEKSIDKYNRILQLNHHIQDEFRKKAKEIKDYNFNKKNLSDTN